MKRIFDVVSAAIGILLLSPVFLAIAVWIKLDSPGPVFFRQVRVGKDGEIFRIHKFRSMRVDAESKGKLTVGKRDKRVTHSGNFIRKFKIDELPQLFDVFFGDMSLVGPRPEVPEYIACYEPNIREKVLSVRPGITDNASILMVDENEILEKYDDPHAAYIEHILPIKQKLYVDYVDNQSFVGDLVIIFKTVIKVITR
ncbi:sugar transferase [Pseudidiomarina insulisalsae]|uniref:Glycosyl transferase n=1 Tax=Pseudidiomarina insulisalsae TaxID=575789 RepID=A0A432YP67_9GAMM|nr:sugar transferase [Pseudidiomarina insulisalsae]RUO62645.1 glycosyl transferase [Pseudidiomarina insulisalsae]